MTVDAPPSARRRRAVNPVLARELKERMRSARAGIIIMIYLLVLTGILKLTSDAATRSAQLSTGCIGPGCPPPNLVLTGSLGRPILHMILFFSLLLVCLIVPALTSGAIAGERERQTLVPLQVTLLRPRSIVVGKLLASLAFVALLVVATLPLLSSAFWVGGVSIGEVVVGAFMVLVTAVVLAALGLCCSAFVRGSRAATVLAYGLMFALTVGTFAVYGISAFNASRTGDEANVAWLIVNPFVATADVVTGQGGAGTSLPSPFTPLQGLLHQGTGFGLLGPVGAHVGPTGFWVLSVASFAVLSMGALWLASLRLRTPAPRP